MPIYAGKPILLLAGYKWVYGGEIENRTCFWLGIGEWDLTCFGLVIGGWDPVGYGHVGYRHVGVCGGL